MNMFRKKPAVATGTDVSQQADYEDPLTNTPKNQWAKIWPVLACGSGLFAEGYVQSVSLPISLVSFFTEGALPPA
jgi:hypothetical protein